MKISFTRSTISIILLTTTGDYYKTASSFTIPSSTSPSFTKISSTTTRANNNHQYSALSMGILVSDGASSSNIPDDAERDFMGLLRPKQSSSSSSSSALPSRHPKNDKNEEQSSSSSSSASWKTDEGVTLGNDNDDPDDLTMAVKTATDAAMELKELEDDSIPIRFVNFDATNPLKQKVVYAPRGTNLLKVGDENGIRIPRQCRSGLCGSCTADVKDPTWTEGSREGYQTVRTCQAGAMIPAGCDEMVIDLYRLIDGSSAVVQGEVTAGGSGAREASLSVSSGGPSMKNFEDGWEGAFVPDYKSGGRAAQDSIAAAAAMATREPEYTVGDSKKKFKRWRPKSCDGIAPWDIVG